MQMIITEQLDQMLKKLHEENLQNKNEIAYSLKTMNTKDGKKNFYHSSILIESISQILMQTQREELQMYQDFL